MAATNAPGKRDRLTFSYVEHRNLYLLFDGSDATTTHDTSWHWGCDIFATSSPAGKPLAGTVELRAVGYPNPFGEAATIRYTLPQAALVTLRLFDVHGRLVRPGRVGRS